jgi:SPP1 gp7 family putative phage head morphogenesis protein
VAIELFERMTKLFAKTSPAQVPAKVPGKMDEELARNVVTILSRWTGPARSCNPDDDLIGLKGMEVYEKMRRDDQVKAALSFKKSAVLSTGWAIHPASDKKPDVEAADFVTWTLGHFEPLYGGFDDILYEQLCLHGDTVVHSPEGDRPIRELVGRRPLVFSYVNGQLVLARASKVTLTRAAAPCVKVTYKWRRWTGRYGTGYTTGEIICTDNHPFLLRDGVTYRKAGRLRPGDRLLPFDVSVAKDGRVKIKPPDSRFIWRGVWTWEHVHRIETPAGMAVHHVDGDRSYDAPDNLEAKACGKHVGDHTHERVAGMTPAERRRWVRPMRLAQRQAMADPERHAAWREQLRTTLAQPPVRARRSAAQLETWQDKEVAARRAAGMRRAWTPERRAAQAQRNRDRVWTDEMRAKKGASQRAAMLAKRHVDNHEIVSVEPWGFADVYDMHVPGAGNFAANCAFVHNSALDFGFSVGELVLRKLDAKPYAGKIGLRTIKVRKPHEFIFDVDEFDNLKPDGLRQSWTSAKGMPIDKFLIFSHQREFGNFRGISDLRSAYQPWWLKDNLWRWAGVYAERFAIPIATAAYPAGNYGEGHPMRALIAAVHDAISNLQANTALTFPNDFELKLHEAGGAGVNVLRILMDMCNLAIARSILMPAQLGLSAETQTGSYAKSKTQFDAFMLVVDDLRRDLADDVINGQLIPRLVGWNFSGLETMPKFDWLPFTDADENNLMNTWMLATQYGLVTPTPEDEAHIRAATKFPEREISDAEEQALQLKNDAVVKKITDQANATLHPKPKRSVRPTATAWGQSPEGEWGAGWGADAGGGNGEGVAGDESAVPAGWGGGQYAADPEFEAKHPRGEGGRFMDKPGKEDDAIAAAVEREPAFGGFLRQALDNLQRSSRTARGVSDTSSSKDKPTLVTEGADLAARTHDNFVRAAQLVWESREAQLDTPRRVEAFITHLAEIVSDGLLPEDASLWRQHETDPKFGQTPVRYLRPALRNFYADFAQRLSDPSDDPIATAAWVERVFDGKIHGLADGSGRTTKLLSALVLARAGLPQPTYPDRQTYYREIAQRPEQWERFYRGLFPKPSLGQRPRTLPARAINWLRESERIASAPMPPPAEPQWGTLGFAREDVERYYAVDPEFEAKHPRGQPENRGQFIETPDTPEPPKIGVGDAGVEGGPGLLRGLDPRTQPHEYAQAYTLALALAAVGEDRDKTRVLVEMLPPELKDLLTPSWYKHTDEQGNYTPEREALHEQIVQKYLDAYKPHEMVQRALDRGDMPPTLLLLAGGTGAGKTTTLGTISPPMVQLGVNVAADDIKMYDLSEWAQLAASDYWEAGAGVLHEESSHIAKQLLNRAMAAKKDIVYDATLRNKAKAMALFDKARKQGYRLELLYVDADPEVALTRAKIRAQESKRFVPENFARVSHQQAPGAFRDYADQLDRWWVYQAGSQKGEPSRRLAVAGKGQRISVEEEDRWEKFITKMGGRLPSTAVHSLWHWKPRRSDSGETSPEMRSVASGSKSPPSSSSPPSTVTTMRLMSDVPLGDEATVARTLDFALSAETLDALEADAAARLKSTLKKTLDALQAVVNKKIGAGDLSLGFVKTLDLKHRAEMTAAVRDFLGLAYRSGWEQGGAAVERVAEHVADPEFEAKHPRERGGLEGGQFAPKGISADPDAGAEDLPWKAGRAITLFRAAASKEPHVGQWSSWAERLDVAEAYTKNQGFGGPAIYRSRLVPKHVLDIAASQPRTEEPFQELASALYDDPKEAEQKGIDWADRYEYIYQVWENDSDVAALLADQYNWVRYNDDYPDGAVTWVRTSVKPLSKIRRHEYAAYARRTHRTPLGLAPEKALQFFDEKALWITGVLKQRLLDDAKAILYNAIKGDTNAPLVLLQLREVFDPWLGDDTAIDPEKEEQVMPYRLETILRTNASEAYARGITDSAQEGIESGYIIAFRSVAVLDSRVTPLCSMLHDKCFRPNSEEAEMFSIPRHWNCRSLMVPVTQDEGPVEFITPAEIGEATGMMASGFGGRQRG